MCLDVEPVVIIFKRKKIRQECNEFIGKKLPFIPEYCNFIVYSFQSDKGIIILQTEKHFIK